MRTVDLLRAALMVFRVFPINEKKVVITAYNGRRYSCNPKYLTEALAKTDAVTYYALKKNVAVELPSSVRRVGYRTISHFYHLMTAKYIVINSTGVTDLLPYRKTQVLINTWHGGGYFKTIGNDFFVKDEQRKNRDISGHNTSFFFASCEVFAKQLPGSMSVKEENVYRTGLPRNDMLFEKHEEIKDKVYKVFNIEWDKRIVLYARLP